MATKNKNLAVNALRNHGEHMGDIEFEMELAPYNNYSGGTPPDKAKYEGLFEGAGEMTTRGQYMPKGSSPESVRNSTKRYLNKKTGKHEKLVPIPDTVQALAAGATPKVWQHEYNHRNNPDRSEYYNRRADAIIAPDKKAWDDAVDMYIDRERGRGVTAEQKSDAQIEEHLVYLVYKDHQRNDSTSAKVYAEERARGATVPESMKTPNWFFDYSDFDEATDYRNMRKDQTYWSKALRNKKVAADK